MKSFLTDCLLYWRNWNRIYKAQVSYEDDPGILAEFSSSEARAAINAHSAGTDREPRSRNRLLLHAGWAAKVLLPIQSTTCDRASSSAGDIQLMNKPNFEEREYREGLTRRFRQLMAEMHQKVPTQVTSRLNSDPEERCRRGNAR